MIQNEADLNNYLLTDLLKSRGLIEDDNQITTITKTVHYCEGSNSMTMKLDYLYERNKAPSSVFVKFDKVRGGEHYQRLARNEIAFYKLAQNFALDEFIPKYINSGYDDRFSYLVLEDLAALYCETGYSPSIDYFRIAAQRIADFHSFCWRVGLSNCLCHKPTILAMNVNIAQLQSDHIKMLNLLGDSLDYRLKGVLEHALYFLKTNVSKINENLNCKKWTIVHGDFHLKNCLFNKQYPTKQLKIIDWQWWDFGIGTYDIAHLLNLYLPKELKNEEITILKLYHQKLLESGFADYSWDECLNDYMIFTLLNLFKPALYAIRCNLRRRKDFWVSFLDNIASSFAVESQSKISMG